MNYEETLAYIHSVSNTFCKPGLDRIKELLLRLENPHKGLKFIHVGGTNGKGSFSAMLSSVLIKSGYKVGLYTSPHLSHITERIKINNEEISAEKFIEYTAAVKPVADSMKDRPTEFELITAVAMLAFSASNCDIIILEVGLGGRLDATNIIDSPVLSVITEISIDHTDYLGDTVEKIAWEKAGIIKKGCPILYAGTSKTAENVIRTRAEELGSQMYNVNYGLLKTVKAGLDGCTFNYKSHYDMQLSLLGLYQPRNAAAVTEATEILKTLGFGISEKSLKDGFKHAKWQARFEVLSKQPLVIFDGAHNKNGIENAVESIKHYFGDEKVYVLSGVLRDKDYAFIAKKISEIASAVYAVTVDYSARALPASEYKSEFIKNSVNAEAFDGIEAAFSSAYADAVKNRKPLIVLGSLYTYTDIVKALEKASRIC